MQAQGPEPLLVSWQSACMWLSGLPLLLQGPHSCLPSRIASVLFSQIRMWTTCPELWYESGMAGSQTCDLSVITIVLRHHTGDIWSQQDSSRRLSSDVVNTLSQWPLHQQWVFCHKLQREWRKGCTVSVFVSSFGLILQYMYERLKPSCMAAIKTTVLKCVKKKRYSVNCFRFLCLHAPCFHCYFLLISYLLLFFCFVVPSKWHA